MTQTIEIQGNIFEIEGNWEEEDVETGIKGRFLVIKIEHSRGDLLSLLLGYHKTMDFIEDIEHLGTQKYLEI